MKRVAWTTERKNVERDRAARLGELQNFFMSSPLVPIFVLLGTVLVIGLAIGLVEHSL